MRDWRRSLATVAHRRTQYGENIPYVFGATAALYYTYWGKWFHFAVFEPGEDPTAFDTALERTHQRYFDLMNGAKARRILELATGGGAFAEWRARRTHGEVVGIDISDAQLTRARRWLVESGLTNVRFLEQDIIRIKVLQEFPFDAAVCLDAASYLPDKACALHAIATRLRPGARFLLVDWCRSEHVSVLQAKLILEPFYRAWGIPEMERVSRCISARRLSPHTVRRSVAADHPELGACVRSGSPRGLRAAHTDASRDGRRERRAIRPSRDAIGEGPVLCCPPRQGSRRRWHSPLCCFSH